MRKIFKRELSFFVTIIAMLGIFAMCEYANAGNDPVIVLTARANQANVVQSSVDSEGNWVLVKGKSCSFNLFCEYNSKPPETEEIKPGTPQWKFEREVICVPANYDVVRSPPTPQEWTTGDSLSGKATVRATIVGEWKLTYNSSVRFPKLKKQDSTPIRDVNGQQLYFGPYSVKVTVPIKVVDAFQITGIDFQGNYDINNKLGKPIVAVGDYEWTTTKQEPVVYKMKYKPKIKIRIQCLTTVNLHKQQKLKLYCDKTKLLDISFGDSSTPVTLNFQNGIATATMTAKSEIMNDIRKGTYIMDWKGDIDPITISQVIYTTHGQPKCKANLFRKDIIEKTVGWATGTTKCDTSNSGVNTVRVIQLAIKSEFKRLGYLQDVGILSDPWSKMPFKKDGKEGGDCVTYADWMAKAMQVLGVSATIETIKINATSLSREKAFFSQKSQPYWLTDEGDIDDDGKLNKNTAGYTSGSAGSRGKLKSIYEDAAGRCIWKTRGPVDFNDYINDKSKTDTDWFNNNTPWNLHGACECVGHWWEITFNSSPDHETPTTMKKIGGPVIKVVCTPDKNKI
jgi:hypothetical protein